MTDNERRHGRLIGRLLESNGRYAVDEAFNWFESETGDICTPEFKVLTIMQAVQLFGLDQHTYNAIRKMYFLAKNQGTNLKSAEIKTLNPSEMKLFTEMCLADANPALEQAIEGYSTSLTYRQKMMVLFRACDLLGIVNDSSYIEVRNFFVKINLADQKSA